MPDANICKGVGSNAPGSFDGARFKWLSANVIETATGRPLGGAQDIDALTAYLNSGYKAPMAAYDPSLPALAIARITQLP